MNGTTSTETDDYNETWSSVARHRSDHYRAMCAAYDKNPTGDTLTIDIHARQLADILPHVLDELDRCKALDLSAATVATEWGIKWWRMKTDSAGLLTGWHDKPAAVAAITERREHFGTTFRYQLATRTVAAWPDSGRYLGPWIADETETP